MKKLILALSLALMLGLAFAQPYTADLFFSEYVEGSSNNKAIEIFNGTGVAVDLSQYTVKLASNGAPGPPPISSPPPEQLPIMTCL